MIPCTERRFADLEQALAREFRRAAEIRDGGQKCRAERIGERAVLLARQKDEVLPVYGDFADSIGHKRRADIDEHAFL